jgi:hypothetical protein
VSASGGYELVAVYNSYYLSRTKNKTPGETTYSSFQFDNLGGDTAIYIYHYDDE